MELLVVVASAIGLRMRNLALAEEAAERKRFERDVALARRIQVNFLPPETPQTRGVGDLRRQHSVPWGLRRLLPGRRASRTTAIWR